MKTAISVPDEIFEEAERLAARLEKSRSQLYSEALAEYVSRHDSDTITRRLDEVWGSLNEPQDRFVAATTRHVLERVEW